MLVKKSIVEKWYQTDSWVYKNFAYLFDNPLWNRDIPNGFTVCPYFWMSLFSLLIFRPFVVFPIRYSIAPLIKVIGWPAVVVDKFLFKTLFKDGEQYRPSIATMLSIMILAAICGVGIIVLFVSQNIYQNYPYFTSTHLGMFSFWSIATFFALLTAIIVHKSATKSKCQSLYYLFPWLALFLITAILYFPSEIGNGSTSLLQTSWDFVVWAFSGIGYGIWYAIKYSGEAIWFAITYTPVPALHIPLWTYFVAIGAIGWIFGMIVDKLDTNKTNDLLENANEPWEIERNRKAWLNLFQKLVIKSDCWRKGESFPSDNEVFKDNEYRQACIDFRLIIFRSALENLFSKELKELESKYPIFDYTEFDELMKSNSGMANAGYRFDVLHNIFQFKIPQLEFNGQLFYKSISKICAMPETHAMVDPLADSYRKKSNPTWHSELCLKITGGIAKFVKSFFKTIRNGFIQVGTFFAYIGILLKAKKQGACPYFRFEDVSKKKS